MKIELRVVGLGNVPGKKNSKQIIPARNGRPPLLITDPKIKKFCDQLTVSFVSQFVSNSAIENAATSTDARLQSLIHSLPHDDCWEVIPVLLSTGELCKKGEEGCFITIEPI